MRRAGEDARPTGPLRPRRRSDRVADLVAWVVSAGALLVLLASVVIGIGSFGSLSDRARAEERDRTPVAAVVLEDAGLVPEAGSGVVVPVRWTEADGIERTGSVEVSGPATAGSGTTIWVTADHRVVRAPLTHTEVVFVATVTALVVLAVGEVTVWLLGRLAFAGVSRMRDGEWAREWAEIESRWTRP
ncbi:Rv1733c family protein [Pseudonocardia xishanensis]|uniref:Integral membrane protein n=1 Tax=Pseudonocardia xishanensis TaxID=630995 RepID=A0ABP8RTK4_9PSEU